MNNKIRLASIIVNCYRSYAKPAAHLFNMRNSAGPFWANPDRLAKNYKSLFFVIPANRLCRNVIASNLPGATHQVINGRNTSCHCEQTLGLRGNLTNPRLLHFVRNDLFKFFRRVCSDRSNPISYRTHEITTTPERRLVMTNKNCDTVWKAEIQLLQNVLDAGTRTLHDVCRCNHDLTLRDLFNNIKTNNTLHASRRICAPWRVTFFLALNHGVV